MLEKILRVLKARKIYQSRATVTLENDTTKVLDLTVPQGKVWHVKRIFMHNGDDVTRTCTVLIRNGTYDIGKVSSISLGANGKADLFPWLASSAPTSYGGGIELLIKGGNSLRLIWYAGGASTGGTAEYCVTYEEELE